LKAKKYYSGSSALVVFVRNQSEYNNTTGVTVLSSFTQSTLFDKCRLSAMWPPILKPGAPAQGV